jgi:cytochrome c551/c552
MLMTLLKKLPFFFLLFLALPVIAQKKIEMRSPDRNIVFSLRVTEKGPVYRVEYKGKTLIEDSGLSLSFKEDGDFGADLSVRKPRFRDVDETYDLVVGKTKTVRNQYREAFIPFTERGGAQRQINLVVRAFNAVTGCCNAAMTIAGGNDGTEIERSRNIDLQTLSLGVDTVRRGANHLEQPSPAQGMELFQKKGCVACHATDSKTEGKIGPPMKDLVGSVRHFVDGSTAIANEVYIRQSIVAPGEKVVKGFQPVMPSFLKILAENEVESIILYLQSL